MKLNSSETKKKLLTGNPVKKHEKEQIDSRPKNDPKRRVLTSNPDKDNEKKLLTD
jgi:hypothetical protein